MGHSVRPKAYDVDEHQGPWKKAFNVVARGLAISAGNYWKN
ncbi:MAG: hypothetical protein ACI8UZ_002474, partial [Akkermansiaceae bacterium]